MELRDLIVTPLLLIVVYGFAYYLRPRYTDNINRRYFIPALTVRIIGALAVGFIYQFYYAGGDTIAYHTHGSRHIWEAFIDNPVYGFKLLFSNGTHEIDTYIYSSRIWYFRDQSSFFVSRVAAVFDLITFSSYSGTAVLFAVVSFIGGWSLFLAFYRRYPDFHKWVAMSCLFIPTVFFWGSGIFKDTLTLAALGIITHQAFKLSSKPKLSGFVILIISCWIVYSTKLYILMSFLPALLAWFIVQHFSKLKSVVLRLLLIPFVIVVILVVSYGTINSLGQNDERYRLDQIAKTAQVTAYDIRYWTGKEAGSGYSLGELDGSLSSLLKLAPAAINVSLFRPYVWEAKNVLMLVSSFEGLILLIVTLYVLAISRRRIFSFMKQPDVLFCLVFSVIFAFAVGVSTYNFGTLSRYKIPLMPYYLLSLGLIYYMSKRERKEPELDVTE